MLEQTGATQLCLNIQPATLLPGCHKIHNVRVRTQALMVPSFSHTSVSLTVTPKALSRALDCILATVLIALHLERIHNVQTLQNFQFPVCKVASNAGSVLYHCHLCLTL